MKSGFLITKNKLRKEFFTSSSAYDRPSWLPLDEATVYATAELADRAAKKLYKNGAYTAGIISLEEMNLSFAPIDRPEDKAPPEEIGNDRESELDRDDPEMQAAEQNDDLCPDCEHDPCTCDDETDDINGSGTDVNSADDINLGLDGEMRFRNDDDDDIDPFDPAAALGAGRNLGMASISPTFTPRRVGEAFAMPKRPERDAAPSENNTTAATLNMKVDQLQLKDPAFTGKDDNDQASSPESKIRVPGEVMSELSATIARYDKEAKSFERSDEARASFALTAADAMRALQDDLSQGTVAGVKAAAIKLSSYMSPITNNVPPSVIKFIYSGGAKPTLKDLFNAKREQR